jgi:hypothetical protein
MIGLGDLVLPGLVIAFGFRVDVAVRSVYYLWLMAAYLLSLIICETVLVFF